MQNSVLWPPAYQVQRSQRARRVRLRICRHRGLQIIIPVRFSFKRIPEVLSENKRWIEKNLLRYQVSDQASSLPDNMNLMALGEAWCITYQPIINATLKLKQLAANQLHVTGDLSDHDAVFKILRRWLQKKAHNHLIPWFVTTSEMTHLSYKRVVIRQAKTRWGSCSAHKCISLNAKLLFLPPILVEHVMVHELCHTIHLDHSRRFWELFENLQPDSRSLQKKLRQAHFTLPTWVDA